MSEESFDKLRTGSSEANTVTTPRRVGARSFTSPDCCQEVQDDKLIVGSESTEADGLYLPLLPTPTSHFEFRTSN